MTDPPTPRTLLTVTAGTVAAILTGAAGLYATAALLEPAGTGYTGTAITQVSAVLAGSGVAATLAGWALLGCFTTGRDRARRMPAVAALAAVGGTTGAATGWLAAAAQVTRTARLGQLDWVTHLTLLVGATLLFQLVVTGTTTTLLTDPATRDEAPAT